MEGEGGFAEVLEETTESDVARHLNDAKVDEVKDCRLSHILSHMPSHMPLHINALDT